MKKTNIALISAAFFLSCGQNREAEKSEARFFSENPKFQRLRPLMPDGRVAELKKPVQIKAMEDVKIDPKKGPDEDFRLTQKGFALPTSRDFQQRVEEVGANLLRLSDDVLLSFALPEGQVLGLQKGDEVRVRYRVKFIGLEMRTLELFSKEKRVLAFIHTGGDRPVSYAMGSLQVSQSKQEKLKLETPSETYYDVAVQAMVKAGRSQSLATGRPVAITTEGGPSWVTLLGSTHTLPKATGSSIEAPLFELRFQVIAR